MVIAFYEDNNPEPVMMMQIEKFDISRLQNTKEKWLEFLGILKEKEKEKINIAWEDKVSIEFKTKLINISKDLEIEPDYLMSIIAFESGETFSSSIKNPYSGAVGLIQFMPQTAISLGTTIDELGKMSAEDQLDYVKEYFKPYKGKLKDLCDLYMVVLYPIGVGKSDNYAIFESDTKCYEQNKGLDVNNDGKVTKQEACTKVIEKYNKGQKNN